ncbi:hypothetical protein GCM10022254_54680 [Actinomadura meridiana]|uniref:OmpR/PhoB-type domain-containing protein n=2 Tax=Actinomadura meridiana TaxID=559626 RepID=A0ABP8CFN1_9ACTN
MLRSLRRGRRMTAEALEWGVIVLPGDGPSLRFEILGRPAAWRDGEELGLGPGKQRAVLAVLLLTPGRPVPTSSIVDAVWGDEPPDNGANVVQKYVAGLRRVLEPDRSPRSPGRLLTLTGAGYALHVPDGGLDAGVFQDGGKEGLEVRGAGDAARAELLLRDALDLWDGTPLAGLNGPFFAAARDRLDEERAAALEAAAEIGLELGEHARLVPELIRSVAEFPLREGFRYLLMLALYRSGRQAESLAAYRDARHFFNEEFGSEPGERLQSLHVGILRSDPALAAPFTANERTGPAEVAPPSSVPGSAGFAPPDPGSDSIPAAAAMPVPDAMSFARPMSGPPPWIAYSGSAYAAPPVGTVSPAYNAPLVSAVLPAYRVPPVSTVSPGYNGPGVGAVPPAYVGPTIGYRSDGASSGKSFGRRLPWVVRVALVLIPVFSFGIATWTPFVYFAARRKSLWHALTAVVYLALTIIFLIAADFLDENRTTWWDPVMAVTLLATVMGGAVHLAVLTAEPWSRQAAAPDVREIERRVRREQARSLVTHHPETARMLNIGRPDLPSTFDDGGLIDVNTAPEHLLASLPGWTPTTPS